MSQYKLAAAVALGRDGHSQRDCAGTPGDVIRCLRSVSSDLFHFLRILSCSMGMTQTAIQLRIGERPAAARASSGILSVSEELSTSMQINSANL